MSDDARKYPPKKIVRNAATDRVATVGKAQGSRSAGGSETSVRVIAANSETHREAIKRLVDR